MVKLSPADRDAIDVACPPSAGERLGGLGPAELRDYGAAGVVWRARAFGDHLVAADGTAVQCTVQGDWERFLVAQVLPLAAVLQGLEVLHAGAVTLDGRALVLTGPSGAGKSTLVSTLVAGGAGFVTDDVAAIEPAEAGVVVHPGPQVGGPSFGASAPVHALVVLRPVLAGEPVTVREIGPDPRLLLGANFLPVLHRPHRLERLLDVCARLASTARVLALDVPRGGPPEDAARALTAELG